MLDDPPEPPEVDAGRVRDALRLACGRERHVVDEVAGDLRPGGRTGGAEVRDQRRHVTERLLAPPVGLLAAAEEHGQGALVRADRAPAHGCVDHLDAPFGPLDCELFRRLRADRRVDDDDRAGRRAARTARGSPR